MRQSAPAGQDKLVAEIKMRRTSHTGSFLVLEGKDDIRFWDNPRRCHYSCRLIDGNGKNNVVRGLQRLDEIEFAGVLGLVDSNYDHLAGKPLLSANIVATDAHDLECLMCRSSALESVLAEFGDREKSNDLNKKPARTSVPLCSVEAWFSAASGGRCSRLVGALPRCEPGAS